MTEQERWWVVVGPLRSNGMTCVDEWPSEESARRVAERLREAGTRHALVGPAPDLLSAINLDPEAFGLPKAMIQLALSREEADRLLRQQIDNTYFAATTKLRAALAREDSNG